MANNIHEGGEEGGDGIHGVIVRVGVGEGPAGEGGEKTGRTRRVEGEGGRLMWLALQGVICKRKDCFCRGRRSS